MAMAERSATTSWEGDLAHGNGVLSGASGALGDLPVTWASRTERSDGKTSPEELIAAAHTACFAMQFSALLGAASGSGQSLEVTADVRLGPDPAGGFRIGGVTLTVSGSAEGVSAEDFARIAQEAKSSCPVSKALAGTDIALVVR